jgi:hypothetical protein
MSMKLLPASVNPDGVSLVSDVSNSLVPLAQRAITTRAGEISLLPSADAFTPSSRTRRGGVNWINATPVEDSQTDETRLSLSEYVSGSAWSSTVERTAVATYLFYAAGFANLKARLISLYA